MLTCMVCDERPVSEADAICCMVPGCDNHQICEGGSCYTLIEDEPVCKHCQRALDSQHRIWAVRRRVLQRRGLNPPATDLDPCREIHEARE